MANVPLENRKPFWQNDRLLVCGMLVFYGLCFVSVSGGAFWWVNLRSQREAVSATATAAEIATQVQQRADQQAQGTATAAAHATEQSTFTFIEPFDSNLRQWPVGEQVYSGWEGLAGIEAGRYFWHVNWSRAPFTHIANFDQPRQLRDFDAYVDVNLVKGKGDDACGGLVFRQSPQGWESGAYTFVICSDSTFRIDYRDPTGWQELSGWKYNDIIRRGDWNRAEVSARGDRFNFAINNLGVYELTDQRLPEGSLALLLDVDYGPAIVWFDNFSYQPR